MPDFGPFSVDPAQVSGLGGANFGQFVSRLLAAETATYGMSGTTLETTYLENVGDGGVDAALRGARETEWIPPGGSAWQFKAGNLSPAGCKAELKGAAWAAEILRTGGTYRLVLGISLTAQKIASRRDELVEAAVELGITDAASRIDVIAADQLARWIESFPALAVSPLLRSTGIVGQTFELWSQSSRHSTTWVSSADRDLQISSLRAAISGNSQRDIRLDGVSGLGKTRLVLEALRGQSFEPIVVYSGAADAFPVTVLYQLQAQQRSAVIVIDECDRKQHEIYAQALTTGSALRLITIGEPGGSSTRSPIMSLGAFGDQSMEQLLRANRPNLSHEASRIVVQIASGNIDYALKLAQAAVMGGLESAGRVVTEDDIRTFFATQLPDGQLFLASCALALFSRFGFVGEPGAEIDAIATGVGLSPRDLRSAVHELQRRGLLSKQGRFRSVGPYPVAVYLAAKGWEEFGHQIVADLLPSLDSELTERLFRRAAEIGELDTASAAITAVLGADGLLSSLDVISRDSNSGLLQHFAVLAPDAVADRLAELITDASEEDLIHARGIRRDLVWTLEKLAWHSKTFAISADALLRLAIAENETYSNNASGTWVECFGAMLPRTAASPLVRMGYLEARAISEDNRVRRLLVRAATRALDPHESLVESGERYGGVVLEPRGTAETFAEVWAYRNAAIDLLAALTTDPDESVSDEATKHLVGSLHGLLEIPANREHLGATIAGLSPSVIARARVEVEELRSLFDRVGTEDGRPAALSSFVGLLPDETSAERLEVLASTKTWDRETKDLAKELADVARMADGTNPSAALLSLLDGEAEVPAAYAIGWALHLLGVDYSDGVAKLAPIAETPNSAALIGFLHILVNDGDTDAFDRYLDEADLSPLVALQYSVRGVRSEAAIARVNRLAETVPVVTGARVLFAWMHGADEAESARYLRLWQERIASQEDYNAVIDFAAMQVFRKSGPLAGLDPAIAELILLRRDYPNLGQESWDWTVLVRRQLESNPLAVVKLIADLVDVDALSAFSGSEEAKLLQEAVRLTEGAGWIELMDRLEQGQWRLSITVQEWLGNVATVEMARHWVGDNVERARTLANVTKPQGELLPPMAKYLIDEFGRDTKVSSYLVGQYISGMWSGNESDRITSQVAEVQSWISEHGQSGAVNSWGRKLIASLQSRHRRVVEEEEERGW